ncbi:MAG TPA: sensor domain-containing protein, partial [Acidimicrobiia bacterium]|nr:sensor domain-containing protein [Acidimicrobiia bacterium]
MFGTVVGAFGALVLLLLLCSLALSFTIVGAFLVLGWAILLAGRLGRLERLRAGAVLGLSIADPHPGGEWWQPVVGTVERWREIAYPAVLLPFGPPGTLVAAGAWLALRLTRRARPDLFVRWTVTEPINPGDRRWWQRVLDRVTDLQTWREIAYLTLLAPIACLGFAVVVAAWTGAAVLLLLPVYNPLLANGGAHILDLMVVDTVPETVLIGAVGIGLALAAPWIARGVASTEGRLAAGLLGPSERAALSSRVDELRARREQLVEVVEAERRRIERDLHDGAQQRLVALAMTLGMAKDK